MIFIDYQKMLMGNRLSNNSWIIATNNPISMEGFDCDCQEILLKTHTEDSWKQ